MQLDEYLNKTGRSIKDFYEEINQFEHISLSHIRNLTKRQRYPSYALEKHIMEATGHLVTHNDWDILREMNPTPWNMS